MLRFPMSKRKMCVGWRPLKCVHGADHRLHPVRFTWARNERVTGQWHSRECYVIVNHWTGTPYHRPTNRREIKTMLYFSICYISYANQHISKKFMFHKDNLCNYLYWNVDGNGTKYKCLHSALFWHVTLCLYTTFVNRRSSAACDYCDQEKGR